MELGNFNIYTSTIFYQNIIFRASLACSITRMKYWMDRCPPNFPRWLYIVLRGLYATCLDMPRHCHPSLSLSLSLSLPPSFDCRATRAWKPRHRSFAGLSLARTFTHVLLHGPGRGRPERSRIQNSCRRNLAVSDLVRF